MLLLNNMKYHLKIISLILTSLLVSSVLVQVVFENNSPTLNKDFVARVQMLPYQIAHPRETYLAWRASRSPGADIARQQGTDVPGDSGIAHVDPSTGGSTAVLPSSTPGDSQGVPHPVTKEEHLAQGYTQTSPNVEIFTKQIDATTTEISMSPNVTFEERREMIDGQEYQVWVPVAAKAE